MEIEANRDRRFRPRERSRRRQLAFPIASLFLALCVSGLRAGEPANGSAPSDKAADEKAKIEFLLKSLEDSKLEFVRNGGKHTGAKAAEHLRDKWKRAGDKVQTARQFIELCGTKSEMTGDPYQVTLADGKTTIPAAAWLETTLAAHEKAKAATPAPPDLKRLKECFAKLADESFEEREKATIEIIRMGPAVRAELAKLEADAKDAEVTSRCEKIRKALDDIEATAVGVLRYIEKSNGTFLRPGARHSRYTAERFAAHLQTKAALASFTLTRPAKEFIEQIATKSSLHDTAYRVILPDGTEKDLKEWLGEKFRLE